MIQKMAMIKKSSLMTESIDDEPNMQATNIKIMKKQKKIDDTTDATSTHSNSS